MSQNQREIEEIEEIEETEKIEETEVIVGKELREGIDKFSRSGNLLGLKKVKKQNQHGELPAVHIIMAFHKATEANHEACARFILNEMGLNTYQRVESILNMPFELIDRAIGWSLVDKKEVSYVIQAISFGNDEQLNFLIGTGFSAPSSFAEAFDHMGPSEANRLTLEAMAKKLGIQVRPEDLEAARNQKTNDDYGWNEYDDIHPFKGVIGYLEDVLA